MPCLQTRPYCRKLPLQWFRRKEGSYWRVPHCNVSLLERLFEECNGTYLLDALGVAEAFDEALESPPV